MDIAALDRQVRLARARQDAHWARARAQLEFADFLVAQQPASAPAWEPAIARARAVVAAASVSPTCDAAAMVAAVERELAPLGEAAKAHQVHLVGHAHIDMNWMWSWPETVALTCDTFSTVLDLMDEFPQFRFTQSQASVYAIVEEFRPDLLERIAARVREGRWEVAASHWVEADKNMAGGEALCRHILYTRRYMQTLFGLSPDDVALDWSPDTFGHAATVPTYLTRGGVKYLYLHRPGIWQQPVPEAFWWEAPDGSRVLVRNDMRRGYNCVIEPGCILEAVKAFRGSTGLPLAMVVYGVGDHGGGPTRRDLLYGLEMQSWPVFPTLRFGGAQAFFGELAASGGGLQTLRGELNSEFAGCYTTQALIKRANRLGEARVQEAETAAALDALAGGAAYPAAAFEANWRRVLFSHFHDILPGSGVHDTRVYAHAQFQATMASTSVIEAQALRHLAGRVDTRRLPGSEALAEDVPTAALAAGQGAGAGIRSREGRLSDAHQHGDSPVRPFLVFNPAAEPRTALVEFTIWDREPFGVPFRLHDKQFEAVTAAGDTRPMQIVHRGNEWGHSNVRALVPLQVPGFGYTTVLVREAAAAGPAGAGVSERDQAVLARRTHHCPYAAIERNAIGLENGLVRVRFDPATGRIRSFVDKRQGTELIAPASSGAGLDYAVERSHGMTAWVIDNSGVAEPATVRTVRDVRNGPYAAAIEIVYEIRESSFTVLYELRVDDPALYVGLTGTWMQRGTPATGIPNLRFALPLALTEPQATYEIPFGAVTRTAAADEEVPALRWAQVSGCVEGGTPAGCLLLNDCKHGHALAGSTLYLNLLRSSYDPDPMPEVGQHELALALVPLSGRLETAEATRLADVFNHPLKIAGTGVHGGDLPLEAQLVAAAGRGAAVSGVKWAEDGSGVIVRASETAGHPSELRLAVHPGLGRLEAAEEVDLCERPLRSLKVHASGVAVPLPAYGLASVKLRVAAGAAIAG